MSKAISLSEKYCYRLLNTFLLAAIFLFCGGRYAGIDVPSGWHIVAAVGTIGLFTAFYGLKVKWRIFCGFFVAAMLICLILAVTPEMAATFLQSYFHWLTGSENWLPAWCLGYEILQTIFFTLIICIGEILLDKYEKLRLVLALLIFLGLLIAMFNKTALSHAGVVCAFFYIMLVCMEQIQKMWKKHRNQDTKVHTLWIMPFLIVYLALMLFMPSPKEPYDWQFVKEAYRQLQSSLSRLTDFTWGRGGDGISPALSGFSNDAQLYGSVSSDMRPIMEIKTQVSLVTNIYLSGKTFDTFDGTQWLQTDKNIDTVQFETIEEFSKTKLYADTAKTVTAVETYGSYSLRNYLSKTTLQITYTDFNSTTVFLPLKTELTREKSDGYEAVYYQLNIDADHFYDLLVWLQEKNSTDYLTERELYTQEVVLSDEVRSYLDEVTKDAENDIEKLRLIEQELSSFTYSHTPGPLPDYVTDAGSFLDYFLLESREGFCTHFATAFVLLARAEGIPARYVQGFCVPAISDEKIIVYSNMAHAWPEVYIDGIGFIPFEPTPGYAAIRYTPWKISTAGEESTGNGAQYRPDVNIPEQETEPEESLTEHTTPSFGFLKRVLSILPLIAALGLFIWVIGKLAEKRRYRKMTLAEKFAAESCVLFYLFGLLGARRASNETLEELSLQVKQLSDYDKKMTDFIRLYEDVHYGKKEVSPEMLDTAKLAKKLLLDSIKRKSTLLYFFQILHLYPYSVH